MPASGLTEIATVAVCSAFFLFLWRGLDLLL